MKTLLAVGVGLGLMAVSACDRRGGPYSPDGFTDTAFLHVEVDGPTCHGYGPADVFIDGTYAATVRPGDAGMTYEVEIGSHGISARAIYVDYQWGPTRIYVPAEGRTHLLYCR